MAQRGVQEQAVGHKDQAAPHGELIVCPGLDAAVVWFQKEAMAKECSSNLICLQCSHTVVFLTPTEGKIAMLELLCSVEIHFRMFSYSNYCTSRPVISSKYHQLL